MKQGMGSVFLYNIIIVFIILVFAFLASAISYSKSFRVNSRIISAIEKYEGYNGASAEEANKNLNVIGYRHDTKKDCPGTYNGGTLVKNNKNEFKYCVYQYKLDGGRYYRYGVLTYMDMELPLINKVLEIPVYSKTNKIYRFTTK